MTHAVFCHYKFKIQITLLQYYNYYYYYSLSLARGPLRIWLFVHVYSVEDDCLESTLDTPQKMENLHAEVGAYGIRYIEIACPVGKT